MSQHIRWEEYFMALAVLVSLRSKDPSTKVGAVLVKDNRVVGTGYNGFPSGCDEDRFSWSRDTSENQWLNSKYPYVIHAEVNALLNAVVSPRDCDLYVTLSPCNECAKQLVQAGVRRIFYASHKYKDEAIFKAADRMLEVTGVEKIHLPPKDININAILESFKAFSELD